MCIAGRSPEVTPIRAPSIATPAAAASWNTGASTAPDTPGRAAAPQAPTPTREAPTRRQRCCASSWSIRCGERERSASRDMKTAGSRPPLLFGWIAGSPPSPRLRRARKSIIQEAPQLPRPRRMLELPQRLGLDLADALSRHRELLADLFQRVVGVHADAEAHAQHALLARRERREHARRGLAQVRLDRGVDRQHRVLVLDEIAEVGILLVADRGFEGDRLLGDLQHLAHLLQRHAELLGKLL